MCWLVGRIAFIATITITVSCSLFSIIPYAFICTSFHFRSAHCYSWFYADTTKESFNENSAVINTGQRYITRNDRDYRVLKQDQEIIFSLFVLKNEKISVGL